MENTGRPPKLESPDTVAVPPPPPVPSTPRPPLPRTAAIQGLKTTPTTRPRSCTPMAGPSSFSPQHAASDATLKTHTPVAALSPEPDHFSPMRISSKDWDVASMIDENKWFEPVARVSAQQDLNELSRIIAKYESSGVPLIVEGWDQREDWCKDKFNMEWLLRTHGDQGMLIAML